MYLVYGNGCDSQESLDRHNCNIEAKVKETSQTKKENQHTCNMCGTQLATRHSLTTHLRSVHGMLIFLP